MVDRPIGQINAHTKKMVFTPNPKYQDIDQLARMLHELHIEGHYTGVIEIEIEICDAERNEYSLISFKNGSRVKTEIEHHCKVGDRDDGVSIDIRVFGIVEDSGIPPRPLDPSHPVHECVKTLRDKCNLTIYPPLPPPTLY